MLEIKYSNLAESDLNNAISYIAEQSPANALEYLSKYEKKIALLRLNPNMGVDCSLKRIKRACRVLIHESHIIVYSLAKPNEILIIRIFHHSENYPNALNKEKK
ncbi:MAG: type II toxin-antitoxin system RelE/ParE family toxin [Campylobacterales bacterium]|nr:type II toxin-antitoxin system RelE/ParE family toxin [Campylobacterales bacterium]